MMSKQQNTVTNAHSKINRHRNENEYMRTLNEEENTYTLTDYMKRSCYHCMIKNCKKIEPHGFNFPMQFCNYVKYPLNINYIKKVIETEGLLNDFEGRKPYYMICRNIHQECKNCKELRIRMIDDDKIVLCYGIPYQNNNTITVGIHIDLNLKIKGNSFKVEHKPIEIDIEKLMNDYVESQNNSTVIYEDINNNREDIKEDIKQNVIEEKVSMMNINVNSEIDGVIENESIEDSKNTNTSVESSFETEFPSLTPTKQIQNVNCFDYSKLCENTDKQVKKETSVVEKVVIVEKTIEDEQQIDLHKIKSLEITNKLLDDENARLKSDILKLSEKISLLQKNINDAQNELRDSKKELREYIDKVDIFIKSYENPETKLYLSRWIQNMYCINNSVLDTFNNTNYKDVPFVEHMYTPSSK